jgi:DNA-binding GntR family transcriptional regulator
VVAPLDPDWIGYLYQVRGALDTLAARLAAENKCDIGPELIAAGRKAARGKNVKAMIDADIAFHTAIYRASGNPLIVENTQLHWVHLRRVMGAVLQSAGQRESIWDEHEAIAKAIASGNAKLAAELSEKHAYIARASLISHLGEVLDSRQNKGKTATVLRAS